MDQIGQSIVNSLVRYVGDFMSSNIFTIFLFLLFFILGWLLFREVRTWYWKINKIVSLLERILVALENNKKDVSENKPIKDMDDKELSGLLNKLK
jgi:hypothetical protein